MQWDTELAVSFETLHPFGLLVRPSDNHVISWKDVPMDKVRSLATRYSLVIFRGFGNVGKDLYAEKAREMGSVQCVWYFKVEIRNWLNFLQAMGIWRGPRSQG